MSFKVTVWRATIGRLLAWMDSAVEQKRIRQSFDRPLVSFRREFMIFYDSGRSVVINSDYGSRESGLEFLIYRTTPLKWRDTGEFLTPEEADRVYSKLSDLLAIKNIRWAYSEMIHRT
jgi:hypothetical protein